MKKKTALGLVILGAAAYLSRGLIRGTAFAMQLAALICWMTALILWLTGPFENPRMKRFSHIMLTLIAACAAAGLVSFVWIEGLIFGGRQGVPMERLLPKLIESCLRAYGASGFDFAVMTPEDARNAGELKTLGFTSQLPLRVLHTQIRRDLLAQAAFDSLTVHKLLEMRCIYQPGCICLPESAMNEIMTQLYRRGLTVVSTRRGYGLYYTKGDTLQFLELQADNDHCADQLLQAAREKTGAANARILLAENQTLYLGAGRRCGYGVVAFLGKSFPLTDAYFRMLL